MRYICKFDRAEWWLFVVMCINVILFLSFVNEMALCYQQVVMNSVDSYMQNIYILYVCCLSD